MVSFSAQTKNELARIFPKRRCCQLAELAALTRMDGTINISREHKIGLQVTTESPAVARKIFRLTKMVFQLNTEIRVQRRQKLKKNNVYNIRLVANPRMGEILEELGILDDQGLIMPGIKKSFMKTKCCRQSYLRGVFLGAGSVNRPEGNYHLEIITNNLQYTEALVALMNRFAGIHAKISSRKDWQIVYLKGSEQIATFLGSIGAHQALLNFENIRIVKGMRNQVNRLVNCETANLSKTVDASLKQIENIRLIEDSIGLNKLPSRLKVIAQLRLQNPDISLKELGKMVHPPVGKSGVNHRMRKIEEIADKIKNGEKPI